VVVLFHSPLACSRSFPVPVLDDMPVASTTLLRTISAVADVLVDVLVVENSGENRTQASPKGYALNS